MPIFDPRPFFRSRQHFPFVVLNTPDLHLLLRRCHVNLMVGTGVFIAGMLIPRVNTFLDVIGWVVAIVGLAIAVPAIGQINGIRNELRLRRRVTRKPTTKHRRGKTSRKERPTQNNNDLTTRRPAVD